MKRLTLLVLALSTCTLSLFSQDVEDKKVQAGFVFSGGMLSTQYATNQKEASGLGGTFGVGMGLHYNFKPHVALYTGVEFNFDSFKHGPTDGNVLYYDYNDREILLKKDEGSAVEGSMQLINRKQNPISLSIPTMLIFRTNFIGYFRYYGKFGLRTSFVINQTTTDDGLITDSNNPLAAPTEGSLEKMKAKNDLLFIRVAGGMAAGAEWNFVGSTSLMFEAGFYYMFTPLFAGNGKDDRNSSSLYNLNTDGSRTYRSFKANQMLIEFKVGILF